MMRRLRLVAECMGKFGSGKGDSETIFDKILNKKIPSEAVYEDELIYAFKDISPQAPVHILIIPKAKDGLTGISQAADRHQALLGHMLVKSKVIADQQGLSEGYRLVVNEGEHGQQTVPHLHFHLVGGRQLRWPPG